jgi:hypothetical protein
LACFTLGLDAEKLREAHKIHHGKLFKENSWEKIFRLWMPENVNRKFAKFRGMTSVGFVVKER